MTAAGRRLLPGVQRGLQELNQAVEASVAMPITVNMTAPITKRPIAVGLARMLMVLS